MGLKRLFVSLLILVIFIPASAAATGVGINTGKIIIDEALEANHTYELPPVTVYNTGDEIGNFEMAVTFNERQPELKPKASWVSFTPKEFSLGPYASQQVSMTISLPSSLKGGTYYSYLEAHTASSPSAGQVTASVSAAAATKFYFNAKEVGSTPTLRAKPRNTAGKQLDGLPGLFSRYLTTGQDNVGNTHKS